MLLYQGHIKQFITHINENVLVDIMLENYYTKWEADPSEAEIRSWRNSLPEVKKIIELAGLTDNMIALEYEVPFNQTRVDCMLFGTDAQGNQNVVLLELKQWTSVTTLDDGYNFAPSDDVLTYTGGKDRKVAHPSQQAKGYHNYIKGFVAEFETDNPLSLYSYAYCHNYEKIAGEGLFKPLYNPTMLEYPLFAKDDTKDLAERISTLLSNGMGLPVFNRFMQSQLQPSKKLLSNVSEAIKNASVFSLLNEQIVARNVIWSKVRRAEKTGEKSVVIVQGGPGTGKSVIAVNLLAIAAQNKKKVVYGCKSTPLVKAMKHRVGENGESLFTNLYAFHPSKAKENNFDLLLIDEAHRIERDIKDDHLKPEQRTKLAQIDQLIRCAKTSVFFIDDKQNVRSQEIGSSSIIREAAARANVRVYEVTLNTQYRCMGSNDYLLWLESALGYTEDIKKLKQNDIFDFQIKDSPSEIYDFISRYELSKPNSARMVAGFCWPWSKKLDSNGQFVKDVVAADLEMPWETHLNIEPGDIPAGYVQWYEWAYKTEGNKQMGCIYTSQGFDFDYVGVIVGNDLRYDPVLKTLKTDITANKDPMLTRNRGAAFDMHVRNIYRTLLSRAMKGCYVYFTDKETEKYFKSLIRKESDSVI